MAIRDLIDTELRKRADVLEECPCGGKGGCPHCGGSGYREHDHVAKAEQFTKPGTANVSPADLKRLQPLIAHYRGKAHPFKSCYRDQIKHGLSPGHAARRCAVLKDLMMGTTAWRKGGVKKASDLDGFERIEAEEDVLKALEPPTEREFNAAVAELQRDLAGGNLIRSFVSRLERGDAMEKVRTGRGSNPRWPKGTPGIGGQWRPDGMPDGAARLAASALGQLDSKNPRHKQLAKDFNEAAKRVDWGREPGRSANVTTRNLVLQTIVRALQDETGSRVSATVLGTAEEDVPDAPSVGDAVETRGGIPVKIIGRRARGRNEEPVTFNNKPLYVGVDSNRSTHEITTDDIVGPARASDVRVVDVNEARRAEESRGMHVIGIGEEGSGRPGPIRSNQTTGGPRRRPPRMREPTVRAPAERPGSEPHVPEAGEVTHVRGPEGVYRVENKTGGGITITQPSGRDRNFQRTSGAIRFLRNKGVGEESRRNAAAIAERTSSGRANVARSIERATTKRDAANTEGLRLKNLADRLGRDPAQRGAATAWRRKSTAKFNQADKWQRKIDELSGARSPGDARPAVSPPGGTRNAAIRSNQTGSSRDPDPGRMTDEELAEERSRLQQSWNNLLTQANADAPMSAAERRNRAVISRRQRKVNAEIDRRGASQTADTPVEEMSLDELREASRASGPDIPRNTPRAQRSRRLAAYRRSNAYKRQKAVEEELSRRLSRDRSADEARVRELSDSTLRRWAAGSGPEAQAAQRELERRQTPAPGVFDGPPELLEADQRRRRGHAEAARRDRGFEYLPSNYREMSAAERARWWKNDSGPRPGNDGPDRPPAGLASASASQLKRYLADAIRDGKPRTARAIERVLRARADSRLGRRGGATALSRDAKKVLRELDFPV